MTISLYNDSALNLTKFLTPGSVDCVITSPPYYGLRTYAVPDMEFSDGWEGQLGAEPHPNMFVQHIGDIFDEIKTCLSDTGVVWLNIGDSAAASGGSGSEEYAKRHRQFGRVIRVGTRQKPRNAPRGWQNKDLLGIPWRCAMELQSRGWIWRETVIWRKTNPTPEPPRDRPKRVYEPIFMFSKGQKYYYNKAHVVTNVWDLPTSKWRGAHFATFPEELPFLCLTLSCPEGGTLLDPFAGSGTTLVVGAQHNRECIGVELSPTYCDMIQKRVREQCGLFTNLVMYGGQHVKT